MNCIEAPETPKYFDDKRRKRLGLRSSLVTPSNILILGIVLIITLFHFMYTTTTIGTLEERIKHELQIKLQNDLALSSASTFNSSTQQINEFREIVSTSNKKIEKIADQVSKLFTASEDAKDVATETEKTIIALKAKVEALADQANKASAKKAILDPKVPIPTDFDSLRTLVEQAHSAIRDVNLRIDSQLVKSVNEIRRAIGMPVVGHANNYDQEDRQQQVALEEIERRQHENGGGEHDSDEEQRERQKIAAEIVARRNANEWQQQQPHEEEDAHQQKQPEAIDGQQYKAPYQQMGHQQQHLNQNKEYRDLHPEDAKYDPYRNADPQQHDYQQPNVAAVGGQVRVKVPNPVSDIVDPLKRSIKQATMIRTEMLSAWGAYKRYAWGHDELKPVSKTFHDWGGKRSKGMALTAVDALSTLWLMGLHEEFEDAVRLVTEEVDYDQSIQVLVFEYTIRVVGGLLSAYELSGEVHAPLLTTAQKVMDRLLVAYNTTTGIPHQTCNMHNKKHWGSDWAQGSAILSEFGSVQLELRTLSYHTKDPQYDIRATHLMDVTESQCKATKGLCPTFFDTHTAQPRNDQLTLGALGDSYYEYLLKQYLLTGKTEKRYERMALEALDEAIERLLQYSSGTRQAFFADIMEGMLDMKMDHLACFSGGMYALAADTFPTYKHVKTFRKVAEGITRTCNQFYERVLSGLSPESVVFTGGMDFVIAEPYNLLRPEALEAIFYQWRMTKDQKYRDWAWEIFLRYFTYCKTPSGGYAGAEIVTIAPPDNDDTMQSFFLAETLKYLYLIFSEDEVLDLSAWVFNTEAHPFKIRNRDPMDIWRDWELHHNGEPAYMPPTINGISIRTETTAMKTLRGDQPLFARRDPLSFEEQPAGEE